MQTRSNGSDPRTAQSRSARSGDGPSRRILPGLPRAPAAAERERRVGCMRHRPMDTPNAQAWVASIMNRMGARVPHRSTIPVRRGRPASHPTDPPRTADLAPLKATVRAEAATFGDGSSPGEQRGVVAGGLNPVTGDCWISSGQVSARPAPTGRPGAARWRLRVCRYLTGTRTGMIVRPRRLPSPPAAG